jgi:hypothetical protein
MKTRPLIQASAACATLMLAASSLASAQPTCSATSGATAPWVVELYTSEGCSSCPPADRWLSTLKGRPDVLALAFHVNYWDRLGWPDRFASAETTGRQHRLAQLAGSRQVYTPQVVAAGRDWRQWPQLPAAAAAPSPVKLTLTRQGDQVVAEVVATAANGATPAGLSGYWAVLEDQHISRVRAGENAGETLRHDHVVRLYQPVPAWGAALGLQGSLAVSRGDPRHPRRVAFVLTDATSARPLQALALAC